MSNQRCFVGFGFGPIQSGLFLYEAFRTGRFSRLVVAEVDDRPIELLRANAGRYALNIAHATAIEQATVGPIKIYNPKRPQDRQKLLEAIGEADELSTALPSVEFYAAGGDASVVSVLCDALRRAARKPRILYAAENHNHAAEILTEHLSNRLDPSMLKDLQAVNTVIGKMSGVITDPAQMQALGLAPLTPSADRAVLVEAFNRILVSRVMPGFERGIEAFIEKDDLLPFEEAKLYGHNAIHALIGYLAHRRGLTRMSQVAQEPDILAIARAAFLEESGAALVRKYAHLHDPFFTAEGYRAYAEDLLERMVNPNLQDLIARVIRDPQRKLTWNDRLFGTMRLALHHDIRPTRMALGAAAALALHLGATPASRDATRAALHAIWGSDAGPKRARDLVELTWEAAGNLEKPAS